VRGWLLDTNILSELRCPGPNAQVLAFVTAQPVPRLHVSSVTMAEIRFGIELVTDSARRSDLSDWLTHTLRPLFDGRVAPISEDVLVRWRQLVEAGRRRGRTYSEPDVLIAASALVEQLVVVTRDVREFVEAGVPVLDPWTRSLSLPGRRDRKFESLDRTDLLDVIGHS
jgi:toxin FitB